MIPEECWCETGVVLNVFLVDVDLNGAPRSVFLLHIYRCLLVWPALWMICQSVKFVAEDEDYFQLAFARVSK